MSACLPSLAHLAAAAPASLAPCFVWQLGVAVVFDEEDEDEPEGRELRSDGDAIVAEVCPGHPRACTASEASPTLPRTARQDISDEEDGDVGLDAAAPRQLARGEGGEEGYEGSGESGSNGLPVSAIDAYWLQRACGRYFNDPVVAQKVAADVLETLTEAEERDCENRLVILLDYDKFELIRLLLKHRYKIACCTRLAQAQSDAERATLLAEFEANEQTAAVVAQLQQARLKTDEIFTETKQLEARVRKETAELARRRASEEGAGVVPIDLLAAVPEEASSRVGVALLDLDALKFNQGGHLMSNQKCSLPAGSFRTQRKGYEEVHIPALQPKARAKLIFRQHLAWAYVSYCATLRALFVGRHSPPTRHLWPSTRFRNGCSLLSLGCTHLTEFNLVSTSTAFVCAYAGDVQRTHFAGLTAGRRDTWQVCSLLV